MKKKKDAFDVSPLHFLASDGKTQNIEREIAKGGNINIRDSEGNTMLLLAAKFKRQETVLWLLDKGANINVKDWTGNTLLHLAVINEWEDIVEELVDKGIDINAVNSEGFSSVFLAFRNRNSV